MCEICGLYLTEFFENNFLPEPISMAILTGLKGATTPWFHPQWLHIFLEVEEEDVVAPVMVLVLPPSELLVIAMDAAGGTRGAGVT